MFKNNKSPSFSLIELSVVLLVISILISGLLAIRSIIQNAEAQQIGRKMNDVDKAISLFYNTYGALPGSFLSKSSCESVGIKSIAADACVEGTATMAAVTTLANAANAYKVNGIALNTYEYADIITNYTANSSVKIDRFAPAAQNLLGTYLVKADLLNNSDVKFNESGELIYPSNSAITATTPAALNTMNSMYDHHFYRSIIGPKSNTRFIPLVNTFLVEDTLMNNFFRSVYGLSGTSGTAGTINNSALANAADVFQNNNYIALVNIEGCSDVAGGACGDSFAAAVSVQTAQRIASKLSNGKPYSQKMIFAKPAKSGTYTTTSMVNSCSKLTSENVTYATSDVDNALNAFNTYNTTDPRFGCNIVFKLSAL